MITFKLMAKGHVRDDCIGELTVAVDDVPSVASESWMTLEKKKGSAEVRLEMRADRGETGEKQAVPVPEGVESKYTIGKEIGRGGFSIVYDGTSKATGQKVAIKVIDKKKQDGEQLVLLQREIDIMKRLKHPNIVALYDVFDDPTHISLVLEYLSGGELYDEIVKRGSFTESDACTVLRQVLSATEYLHANGIAHRDLKPENLLISSDSGGLEVKIADFGLSKDFSGSSTMSTCCGSPSYVAPEVLQQGVYSRVVEFQDASFQAARESEQREIYENWSELLNTFDNTVHLQVKILCRVIDRDAFREDTFLPPVEGDYAGNRFRRDINQIIESKVAETQQNVERRRLFIVTVEARR